MRTLTATAQRILAHQRRRQSAIIVVPAHWAGAEQADLERWIICQIWDTVQGADGRFIDLCGVRNGLRYHGARNPGWKDVRTSRLIRRAGAVAEIQFVIGDKA